jgi:hypothetical protein
MDGSITPRQFQDAAGVEDWRVVFHLPMSGYRRIRVREV